MEEKDYIKQKKLNPELKTSTLDNLPYLFQIKVKTNNYYIIIR